ncbi:MAG: hypothetical protein ACYC2W_08865, partial [Desulfurivibrionaceae bacterium]
KKFSQPVMLRCESSLFSVMARRLAQCAGQPCRHHVMLTFPREPLFFTKINDLVGNPLILPFTKPDHPRLFQTKDQRLSPLS